MAVLSEEQTMLRDGAKDWAAEKAPVAALRRLRDQGSDVGFDRAAWTEMGEMGWAGVIVPEAYGGSEFGYRSLGLVLEETGRTLTASPLISTALVGASALGTEVTFDMNSFLFGRTVKGVIEGDSIGDVFIPQLIELWRQGRFPFDKLIKFYELAEINEACAASESGAVLKPVLRPPAG